MVLTQRSPSASSDIIHAFPYHYGSHATQLRQCCNSAFFVSIPLWFSRNEESRDLWRCGQLVSIPLWFSRNQRRRNEKLVDPSVSIPLWFSRNFLLFKPYTAISNVSIPLWFSRNQRSGRTLRPVQYVSIPLWFSRNPMTYEEVEEEFFRFPYHYGSHATIQQ